MAEVVLKSTVMVQDGTKRQVHLVRTDDGLYTLIAASGDTDAGFQVDLTQGVLWAAQYEIFHGTPHWELIQQRMREQIGELVATGKPLPSHIAAAMEQARLKIGEEFFAEKPNLPEPEPPREGDPAEVRLYERPDGTPTTQAEGNTPLPSRRERYEAAMRERSANPTGEPNREGGW